MAETWTSRATPSSALIRAIRAAPSSSTASKVCLPASARMPTQLTTAAAPAMAARVEASSRMLAWIGSTWPTTP